MSKWTASRWADAGLIGLAGGLGALFYADAPGKPINLGIGIAACLAVPVRRRWLGITNPMPAAPASRLPGAGSGLIGLSERMHLVGGRLEHGRTETGGRPSTCAPAGNRPR